ncbi:hypothetical protein KQX54_020865 [Cotesia glomerata]|uniref:Uncharacterized protein n=1 Tax=Cotesia glomerata TaxID=32391 RepID=A0AAV7II25_COTGL|nr:hypothetical protein KQX54_020865 [Cotesia glomerata]
MAATNKGTVNLVPPLTGAFPLGSSNNRARCSQNRIGLMTWTFVWSVNPLKTRSIYICLIQVSPSTLKTACCVLYVASYALYT